MGRLFRLNLRVWKPRNLLATVGRWFSLGWWQSRTRRQRLLAGGLALVVLAGVLVPLVAFKKPAEAATWWSTSWAYRRKVSFNNIPSSSNLASFPVRISLTSSNIDYGNTQNSGQDIRFVDSDDSTALSYEIEKWNESGTSEVWVEVPQVNAVSTTDFIWMYYGNAGASDGQAATGVWDTSNYKLVHHLEETGSCTGSNSVTDSTANANHGTCAGSPNAITTGKIGAAREFVVADTDYIENNSVAADVADGSVTVSAWFKLTSNFSSANITDMDIMNIGSSSTQAEVGVYLAQSDGTLNFGLVDSGGTYRDAKSSQTSWTAGTWYHVHGTFESGGSGLDTVLYVDGVQAGTHTNNSRHATDPTQARIAAFHGTSDRFGGTLDEVRVSGAHRTADWVMAEHRTSTNTMNTFAAQETQSDTAAAWCADSTGGVTCDTNWTVRRPVHFINTQATANLASFPVLVILNSSNIDYSKTQNSGQDIRFVDPADPTVVLPHEIENWNESGDSHVWVKVPQLNYGTNTGYIWMYYNNAGAADGQAATSTWDTNYKLVHHLEETGSCTGTNAVTDSTSNANHGTCAGSPNAISAGKVGAAREFVVADTDYVQNDSVALDVADGSITFSAWFKLTSNFTSANSTDMNIMTIGTSGTTAEADIYLDEVDGALRFAVTDSGGTDRDAISSQTSWTAGTWYHVHGTFESGGSGLDTVLYVDGVQAGTHTNNSRHATDPTQARIAAYVGTSDRFGGTLDEVRISSTHRTADWVMAEHLTDTNTMNTFGAEEGYLPPPTLIAFVGNTSTAPTFQLRGSDPVSPSYLRYKIDVCTVSDCSIVLRTIDQTSSQTGWTGQDAQTSTAYVASSTLGSSTLASHTYQAPALTAGTTYWWRGYSIDPSGTSQWTSPSAISSFATAGQNAPAAPTLSAPAAGATGVSTLPAFTLRTTDAEADYLRYKIDVCSVSDCSSIVRTIDQTSSQTGWSGQDAQTSTAYVGAASIGSSTMATHTYQTAALSNSTTYWWRAYAIDPGGTNTFSTASPIRSFTTAAVQATPAAPTLVSPPGGGATTVTPDFQLRSTDANSDYLRYKIEVCSVSDCSSIVRTIDQTASQTGWIGQDAQSGTAYSSSSVISSSTVATHTYQPAVLTFNTQYWWRAYAIDPGGTNTFSAASSIATFTTSVVPGGTSSQINGGTVIRGGTTLR